MEALEWIRSHALALPNLAKFALAMAILVGVPPLSRRIRLPAVVGLLLCGVVIGPHVLQLFPLHPSIAQFFADLGKLLLMFFAGLEIDLALFRRARTRSIIFGLLTTSIPLALGTAVGLLFKYSAVAAVVLGSLLASHTLLGLPIITKLGKTRIEPVTVTVGATVMSDTLSLVVFAICAGIFHTGFSMLNLGVQLVEIVIFVLLVLFGLSRLASYLLKRSENDEDSYFILMLVIMAVASLLAQVINLPGIVGSFLGGLAVNSAVHDKPAKGMLEFLANSLFIPIFFVVTGFLIDPLVFFDTIIGNFALATAVLLALVVGKWIAAEIAGRAFHYGSAERVTVWSLTLPQVAATLAGALAAFDTYDRAGQRLIDVRLLNVVLVLMLSTSILGPLMTARFAPRMLSERAPETLPSNGAKKAV
jgi:Kef-type K+ transport system membrane component KefB